MQFSGEGYGLIKKKKNGFFLFGWEGEGGKAQVVMFMFIFKNEYVLAQQMRHKR